MNMTDYANDLLRGMAAAQIKDRQLSPDEPRGCDELTAEETNAIQREIEIRASNEADECVERFRDWLNSKGGRRARQDYTDHRCNTATDDERREIFEGL